MIDTQDFKTKIVFTTLLSCSLLTISCTQQNNTESSAASSDTKTQQASVKKAATNKPNTPEQKMLDAGSQLWAEKKPDLAEAKFRKVIELNPESAQAHSRLAGLLLTQNKTSEAIPVYQEAINLNPKDPKLFASLSIAYLHQSQYGMAKSMAAEALRLAPDMTQAKKLSEYIEAKEEIIEQAAKVPADQLEKAKKNAVNMGTAPKDATHGSTSIPATAHQAATKSLHGTSGNTASAPETATPHP